MKNEIMKAIEEGRLYDFIANNYWRMSKEELKDVLLEVIWSNDPTDENKEYLLANLSERWSD